VEAVVVIVEERNSYSIEDTGPGIETELEWKISLTPFVQVKAGRGVRWNWLLGLALSMKPWLKLDAGSLWSKKAAKVWDANHH